MSQFGDAVYNLLEQWRYPFFKSTVTGETIKKKK